MSIAKALNRTASAVAIALALGTVVGSTTSWVVTEAAAAVVARVVVTGNRRVDDDTIRGFLTIRPGTNFGPGDIDASIRQLFNTGLFADVRVRQEGNALVVEVIEQAIVNEVLFIGNAKVKDDRLGAITQTNARGAFDPATIASDEDAIRAAYDSIGRTVNVTSEIDTIEDGRVNVTFRIDEGDRLGIDSIDFVGNDAFGDRRLRSVINTKRSNPLTFLSRRDVFDEDRVAADEERLRRFYFDRGYADFRVVETTANLDETNNRYSVTFNVDEGQQYRFGNITIDSTVPGLDAEGLRRSLVSRTGNVYSASEIEDTLVALSEAVANRGFAFADVTPRGSRNFANNTIDVDYVIDEGPRVFIERIEIRGNSRTRDFVIRREFEISEGDAFNRIQIRRTKERLEELGFFETVDVRTVPGSQPDRIIVVVQVDDKSTGEFGVGAGYQTAGADATSGTPKFDLSITERNLLGRGQFVRASVSGSTKDRSYAFSFTEPFFLGRRIAAGFDLERSTENLDGYDSETRRGSLRMTAPLTEDLSATVFYSYQRQEYDPEASDLNGDGIIQNTPFTPAGATLRDVETCPVGVADPNQNVIVCSDIRNLDGYVSSSGGYALTFDRLDNRQNPRSGYYAQFRQEFAGLGGDANWLKTTVQGRYYQPISEEFDVFGLVKASAGNITGLGDDLRSFDHFYISPSILRGFGSRGIGPRDANTNGGQGSRAAIGGTNFVAASAEVNFPLPVIPEEVGLRGAIFADAASVWGYGGATTLTDAAGNVNTISPVNDDFDLRASVGVSVLWSSPFGPLRLDYAEPVVKQDGDVERKFNFGISSNF